MILKRILLAIAIVFGLILVVITYAYFRCSITLFDQPWKLSGRAETIEVFHVAWACDCADWIETRYLKPDPDDEINPEDCIFIEPANDEAKIPDSVYIELYGRKIELVGQFYSDKGIPDSYVMNTDEKPDKARVFRYDGFRVLE